jgi:GWxTD domain-containing protein
MRTPLFGWFAIFFLAFPAAGLAQEDSSRIRAEEAEDYYRKWLDEDVVYIITSEEREVFRTLTTPEEREQFIEQFWIRRDPDLTTSVNEYKEEHYRRIAYANERFKSGIPGWRTDRGRIYIIHGPPVEIASHRMGQAYDRPSHEGGGHTRSYPFEVWRYRHIEGVGTDVEIEFVDPGGSGEFRLALTPWEKDALLLIPGAGLTLAEELGYAAREDHPYFKPYNADRYVGMHTRAIDDPFIRYENLIALQRPLPVKYRDLKELVDVNIAYEGLAFDTRQDYFRLGRDRVLASVSLEVDNRQLSFPEEGAAHVARVAVYGLVTSLTGRVVTEFEDDLVVSFSSRSLTAGLQGRSVYQKVLPLDRAMRYRLDLILKDLHSGRVGVTRIGLIPPALEEEKLSASSLILSDSLTRLEDIPATEEMFVIGDIKVRPNLRKVFGPEDSGWVYLHVYNAQLDQSAFEPSLTVTYRVTRDGRRVSEFVDRGGESIQFFSGQRIVLIGDLPIAELEAGRYRLEVVVEDRLSSETLTLSEMFEVRG